jgi:hypothetical protein
MEAAKKRRLEHLEAGKSPAVIQRNIRTEIASGRKPDQAVAIAYRKAAESARAVESVIEAVKLIAEVTSRPPTTLEQWFASLTPRSRKRVNESGKRKMSVEEWLRSC